MYTYTLNCETPTLDSAGYDWETAYTTREAAIAALPQAALRDGETVYLIGWDSKGWGHTMDIVTRELWEVVA